ncbi:ATP-binding cassette domain-containing protein [Enterococcus sp. BWB1-3]|uniref:ABC transporter ATP-binding protein n=1 Tax=unclassified Enterococcus TaxID=2608891 RepID=UPI0019232147|nr:MULTISPECIES: ATP-binding cassette domain-containing protein [unclassified Enterococcus]MBL1227765.1 ATP-binding cassette domain-containing protein [Enterococcus sp. BWB1-3]MCB5952047.1 ATP-binding cassette domain-containing protein [Enterococcus sp. BWT-B8]MCB5954544.1 ATP-binding cassette domain-containing protein [Enterococcus sp. CWB-B31]
MNVEKRKLLLDVKGLKQYFNVGRPDEVKAVDDISFHIYEGETFGLVGESGSGKSTTGRSVIRLYNPTAGEIIFDGENIADIRSKQKMQAFRREVQMIFQDPYASLNPRMKVNDIIAEGLDINHLVNNDKERTAKVEELLKVVGLDPNHASRYPHEFSGGQRQRIGIARALAVDPKFIICDEPISALDVSIQAQVVNLLQDLQKESGLTYLFIAHDLSMVKHISDRIGVMHSGKLLEMGSSDDIYNFGVHPYTESLLSAIPLPDPDYERTRKRIIYKPQPEDGKERKLREVAPEHYVYCSEDEVEMYHEKIENRKAQAHQ